MDHISPASQYPSKIKPKSPAVSITQDFDFLVSYLVGKTFIHTREAVSFLLSTISLFSLHWVDVAFIIYRLRIKDCYPHCFGYLSILHNTEGQESSSNYPHLLPVTFALISPSRNMIKTSCLILKLGNGGSMAILIDSIHLSTFPKKDIYHLIHTSSYMKRRQPVHLYHSLLLQVASRIEQFLPL